VLICSVSYKSLGDCDAGGTQLDWFVELKLGLAVMMGSDSDGFCVLDIVQMFSRQAKRVFVRAKTLYYEIPSNLTGCGLDTKGKSFALI
jgi:hypothetical protein